MSQRLAHRVPNFIIGDAMVVWYQKHKRSLPWRQRFEKTRDPYLIWVSEIMLQQTTIQAVLPAYERFLQEFPDLPSLAAADEQAVRLACRGLGYYRRFRMMHAAAKILSQQQPFTWPANFKAWHDLPGIGDYTAAAICSIALQIPKAVVDGNVERVFCRLLDLRIIPDAKLKKNLQQLGDSLIPALAPGDYNQAVMELGQTICTKQNPNCAACPLQQVCHAYAAQSQHLAPAPRKALDYENVRLHLWLPIRSGKVGLVHRSVDAKFLGGTLGLPTAWEKADGILRWQQSGALNFKLNALGSFKHSITRHKIQAFVHHRELKAEQTKGFIWVPLDQVEAQLVSNLDRKALQLYEKHAMS